MQTRHLIAGWVVGVLTLAGTMAYANGSPAKDFVHKASMANEFEIESSNLALQKSANDDVREFAQKMIDDHSKTKGELEQALENSVSNAHMAGGLDKKHERMMEQLQDASAEDFDDDYVSMQTAAHKEAVGLFSDYARNGKDPALKKFASDTLPTLKAHLKHVERLNSNM